MAFYLGELENSAEKPASALDFYRKAIGFLRIDPKKPELLLDNWTPKIPFAEAATLAKTGDLRAATAEYLRGFGSLGAMRRRAVSDNSKFRLADEQRLFCEKAMPAVHALKKTRPTRPPSVGCSQIIGYAKSSALFDGAQRAICTKLQPPSA